MPVTARCPSCAAPLSETSVLALAPVCSNCGSVITSIGGTLGLTSAYGVGDSSITRSRIEADLLVLREYQTRYRGMQEAYRQQLGWGVERYATLPLSPELLQVEAVPTIWNQVVTGLRSGCAILPGTGCALLIVLVICAPAIKRTFGPINLTKPFGVRGVPLFDELFWVLCISAILTWAARISMGLWARSRVQAANGKRPLENARRQEAYEQAKATALIAAERMKAAEDHRLRYQIRELEGLTKTVSEKEADVRRILATL